MRLPASLALRGWVIREGGYDSDPILVRGARREDHYVDYRRGFVYAENAGEAETYDKEHKYIYLTNQKF